MVAARTFERHVLDNGVRVLLAPDPTSSLATVAVTWDVGWRDEEPGRAGFAHLFEHLMFEGSPNLPRGAYDRLIAGAGGANTAYTRADFTNYWSQVPAEAVELSIWAEADRMRGCTIDAEALATQISVVKEEIRVNVRNKPYGAFPFLDVPPVLFSSYANSHDVYGSFEELERATLEEVQEFFARHYVPAAALVTVHGGVDVEAALELVRRHFGTVPAGPAPARAAGYDEPAPAQPRHAVLMDQHAPLPAVAVGLRVPDPLAEFDDYLACYLVDRVLTAGEDSRLHRRLVRDEGVAHAVSGWFGIVDQPFGSRHPSLAQVAVHHASGMTQRVLDAIDAEIAAVAAGIEPAELERVVNVERAEHWQRLDSQIMRAITVSTWEAIHGRAELIDELPERLARLTVDDLSRVAKLWWSAPGRAVVEVRPGGSA